MAIITNIKTKGSKQTSTLSGNIIIDEGAGELRITKKIGNDIVVINKIDITGNHYYDIDGNERISTGIDDTTGYMRQVFIDANGKKRIIIGQNPADGDQIVAVSTANNDVEEELSGGLLAMSGGFGASPEPEPTPEGE